MDHQAEQADAWHENRTTNDTVRYGRRAVVGRFAAFSAAIFAAFAARSSSCSLMHLRAANSFMDRRVDTGVATVGLT
jgi:hypothetical protein